MEKNDIKNQIFGRNLSGTDYVLNDKQSNLTSNNMRTK